MKIDPIKHRCLLIDKLETPSYRGEYSDNTFFRATVANYSEDGTTPRNWRVPYSFERIKGETGGCQISAFVSKWQDEPSRVLVSNGGPNVTKGEIDEYQHGADALRIIHRRMSKLYDQRGPVSGPAEEIARWIEATGVNSVFIRPEGQRDTGWLNAGAWLSLTPGQFNSRMIAELAKLNRAKEESAA
jgi:hypothetical protein